MKTKLPNIDLPLHFVAGALEDDLILNMYRFPCRIQAAMFALCQNGELDATVNLQRHLIGDGEIITILPGTIIQFHKMTPGTVVRFIGFSHALFNGHGIAKHQIDFLSAATRAPVLRLTDKANQLAVNYFILLQDALFSGEMKDSEMIQAALTGTVFFLKNQYLRRTRESEMVLNRGEKIYKDLTLLVMKHFETEKRVGFYAEKLNVTPQHLSSTVRKVAGKTVSDVIAEIVVTDAKSKLKSTTMTVQEISDSLNFPNASFFGKYFKRHSGISPREYRLKPDI